MLRQSLVFCALITQTVTAESYVLSRIDSAAAEVVSESGADIHTMPGSLLKPLFALYLLEKVPEFRPQQKVFCPGWSGRVQGVAHACWLEPGHRQVDLTRAIKESCNYYFYSLAAGLSRADYFSYLSREFGFPPGVEAREIDGFLGDRLSRTLSLREIAGVMNRLYFRLARDDAAARVVWGGMEQARFGTLSDITKDFATQKHFRLLAGKTGTVRSGRFSVGMVFLIFEKNRDRSKYTLLYYRPNLMGGKIPGKDLVAILNKVK